MDSLLKKYAYKTLVQKYYLQRKFNKVIHVNLGELKENLFSNFCEQKYRKDENSLVLIYMIYLDSHRKVGTVTCTHRRSPAGLSSILRGKMPKKQRTSLWYSTRYTPMARLANKNSTSSVCSQFISHTWANLFRTLLWLSTNH